MKSIRHGSLTMFLAATVSLLLTSCQAGTRSPDTLKLYALNCGTLKVSDMRWFSDDGQLDGKQATLANPCFLIRHPDGDLLWDTGYQQSLAQQPEGVVFHEVFHKSMSSTLVEQLAMLKISPADIDYLALSHAHDDHVGNANLFTNATLVVQASEHRDMFSAEYRAVPELFNLYSALEQAKTITYIHEYDVFADGKVVVRAMPGHTGGSSVLLLQLSSAGRVLLSGDLYTQRKERELQLTPRFTTSKEALNTSRQKFEQIAKSLNARIVIQHDKSDFDSLPAFPDFLQ